MVGKVERMRPLAEARDCTLAELALLYCLAHEAVSTIISGAKTAAQAHDNARASELTPLTQEEMTHIQKIAQDETG